MKNRIKGKIAERVQVQLPSVSYSDATKLALEQVEDQSDYQMVVHKTINILRHQCSICFPHTDWQLWDRWAHRGHNEKVYFDIKLKVLWMLREHCQTSRMALKAIKEQIAVTKKRQEYTEIGNYGYLQC